MTNKKLLKSISLIVSCVLTLGVVSGCGEKKVDDGKTVISLGSTFPDEKANPAAYENTVNLVKKFTDKYPDIVVEDGHYEFAADTYMTKAEGGTLPTAYYVPLTEVEKIKDLNYAADLTSYFEKNGYMDNFNETSLDLISRDGKIYFMPEQFYYVGVVVNLELYKKAGFVEADGSLYQPDTWDDFARVAQTIKEKTGVDGFMMPTTNNCGGWRFTPIAWSNGTVFETKESDGSWKATFNSPEFIKSVQYLSDLKWKYNAMPENALLSLDDVTAQFAAGNVGMIFGEPNLITGLVQNYKMDKDKIGMLKMPRGDKKRVTLFGGGVRVIDRNATESQMDAALKWLEFNGYSYKIDDERKTNIENSYIRKTENGDLIGIRNMSPWKADSEYEKVQSEMIDKYINVDSKHIEKFNDINELEFQVEEPIDAQALYAVLDNIIQEVLTNKNADIESIVSKAADDFQRNNLDFAK